MFARPFVVLTSINVHERRGRWSEMDGHDHGSRRLKINRNETGTLCHGQITFSAKIERFAERIG